MGHDYKRAQLNIYDDSPMPKRQRKDRSCRWQGCITPLSDNNPNDYCWLHLRIMITHHFEKFEKELKRDKVIKAKKKRLKRLQQKKVKQ